MCVGCLTTIDKYVYAAVGLGAALEVGCERLRALFDAEFAAERQALVWERNAAFCRTMELDPVTVLGARPAVLPVREPVIALPEWAPTALAPA
jgi:hypothetical protein